MVEGKMEFLAQERETTGTGTAVIHIGGCTIGSTAVLCRHPGIHGRKGLRGNTVLCESNSQFLLGAPNG